MLILASLSPIRAQILRDFGIDFVQKSVDFDEDSLTLTAPKSFAYKACVGKLERALELFGKESKILVADSVVSVGGILQRKPRDLEQARAMLESQNNATIHIITAQILKSPKIELCDISQASFTLGKFDPTELEEYLHSRSWEGKAGGVMMEGFHGHYIREQRGLLSTAMGLSLEKFLPFFEII